MVRTVKKSADRRAEIVQAARNLFQTKDYNNATMQDVMDALGIAKGTIYHYFKSKEALFEAVIEDIVDKSVEQMQSQVKEANGNALEKIKLLVKAGSRADENQNILDELHKPSNDAMHSRLLAAAIMKQAPLYAEIIQQGCEEGIFQTSSPLECAEFLLSGVQFLTDMGIYPWTQEDLERRIEAFPKLIEQLLNAPAGSFQFLAEQMQEAK